MSPGTFQVEPPVPIHMMFKFLTVENRLDVRDKGAKAKLVEAGPYAYKEIRRKQDIANGGANSMFYNEYRSYSYDQGKTDAEGCKYNGTTCSKDDKIVILNPIIALVGAMWPKIPDEITINGMTIDISPYKPLLVGIINAKLDGSQAIEDDLFFETSVDEILFKVTGTLEASYQSFK